MADRIAGEAPERRAPIWHIGAPDRAQGEQIIKREREITAGDAQPRQGDVPPVGGHQRVEHLGAVDGAQDAVERGDRDRDDRQAEHNPDSVPADLLVAEPCGSTQAIEHSPPTIRWCSVHQPIRRAPYGLIMHIDAYRRCNARFRSAPCRRPAHPLPQGVPRDGG